MEQRVQPQPMNGYSLIRRLERFNEEIEAALDEKVGEIDEEIEAMMADLELLQETAVAKVSTYGRVLRSLQRLHSSIEGQKSFYYGKYKDASRNVTSLENAMERLSFRAGQLMEAANLKKTESDGYTVSLRYKNSVEVYNEGLALNHLPEQCIRIRKEVDKSEVKKMLKDTEVMVPGVRIDTRPYAKV